MPFSPAEEKLSKHSLTTLFSLLFAHFWRKHKKVKAIIASSSVTFIPIKSEQLFRFPRKLRFFIELLKAIRRGLNTLLSSNYDKIFSFFQRRGSMTLTTHQVVQSVKSNVYELESIQYSIEYIKESAFKCCAKSIS